MGFRENQEMKQIRASQLRKRSLTMSGLFNKAHTAHHKKIVDKARMNSQISGLERKLHEEKMKNTTQIDKVSRT